MLRILSTTAIILGVTLAVGSAQAQSLRNADQPAEFPPASFTGKQYVDSKGCVFVRAGFDGNISWVPRVSRQRKVLCGFSPTFAAAPKPEVPTVADTPRVVASIAPTKPPRPAAPTVTTPRPTVTARPTPPPTTKPAPTRVVTATPVRTQPPAQVVRPAQTKPVVVQPPAQVAGTCPGVTGVSAKYVGNSGVRCGPQGNHPGNYAVPGNYAPASPAGVVRVSPPPKIQPPEGYKAAFDDDRFNPNRGLQTREGFHQMRLVWTSGVPRRLVDQNSRRDVTSLFPGLKFPFISYKQQKAYVAKHGWPAASGNVTVATKNTPTQVVTPSTPSGHRYVQVGTFGSEGNARNTAARLQQLGLPVRMGKYKKSGKTYLVVLAGPFNNGSSLSGALNTARRAGFSDAFTRK